MLSLQASVDTDSRSSTPSRTSAGVTAMMRHGYRHSALPHGAELSSAVEIQTDKDANQRKRLTERTILASRQLSTRLGLMGLGWWGANLPTQERQVGSRSRAISLRETAPRPASEEGKLELTEGLRSPERPQWRDARRIPLRESAVRAVRGAEARDRSAAYVPISHDAKYLPVPWSTCRWRRPFQPASDVLFLCR